jgi:hypothetical protein
LATIIGRRAALLPLLWITAGFGLSLALEAASQATAERPNPAPELLNSERIERTFGNYGIQVLESDAMFRVSNLYSAEGGTNICRTFAIVRYPDTIAPAFATEHAAILVGGSIGAVFAANGWTVQKFHRHYGHVPATAKVAELMHIAPETALALHVYALDVVKGGARFHYAAIVEVHHPAYLTADDLPAIYGKVRDDIDAETQSMLDAAAAKMRGSP